MADDPDSPKTLKIEKIIEGEHVETSDYFFCKVGDALPLSSSSSAFDTAYIPSKPLLLSSQFGLLFAAHSTGFCVAKMKDVYAAAKDVKEDGSGSSVQEYSVVDVDDIGGRVSILALSDDSSLVSAVVGSDIHIFSVKSLLNKDKKPAFSCSVESNHVKDMLWIKDTNPKYIVLTDDKKLHVGALYIPLTFMMDEIDAVEKSVDGEFLAIGRKNSLLVVSAKFKKILQIFLPLDSFTGDNSATDTVKVDSIRWVRPDCIVVGCVKQTEDVREENYFLQVITSGDNSVIDDSSKLAAVQFSDLFPGLVDDIVPSGCGPHLFMYYLENCEFAFVSNRKNTDQHIMLFSWSQGDNQVTVVDIERDSWLPRIGLQENGDDNLVLGLCVDETSVYENVKVKVGLDEQREFQPHCLLVCLTVDGKLVMFNVASIAGPQRANQALSALSPNSQNIPAVSGPSPVESPSQSEEERSKLSGLDTTKISFSVDGVPVTKNPTTGSNFILGSSFYDSARKDPIDGNDGLETITDVKTSRPFGHLGHSQQRTSDQFSKNSHAQFSSAVAGNNYGLEKSNIECTSALSAKSHEKKLLDLNKGATKKLESGVSHSTLTTMSSSNVQGTSGVSNARSPFNSPSSARSTIIGNPSVSNNAGNFISNPSIGTAMNLTRSVTEMPQMSPGVKSQSREVVTSQNSISNSLQSVKGNHQKSFGQMNTEHNFPKQFGNVQNMAKELDNLLERIEEAGGFRDSCTTAHRSSLEALEEGMKNLSERSRMWKCVTEERLKEMELLLDKTVQVLARKTHMEGIVRQTTDGQYWDLWNRQKLNSELDQKRLNILNLSQDLVNRMIDLERHFNALELSLFGESSGTSLVSRNLHCRSATSRFSQSLNAIHNATVSQLAAAQQLSDFLSRQMSVLSIKSPPAKQANIKRQVFESIGIPYSEDNLASPNMVKVFDTPPNKHPVVSSAATNKELKRNQLSGQRTDHETSRRRRDSIDRSWAKFEAPRTTVKRTPVWDERKNISGFSSVDKQFVSPFKLEGSVSTHPKALGLQNRIAGKDVQEKFNSGPISTSAFKWAGTYPESTQVEAEQSSRLPLVQGNRSTAVQTMSVSSSPTPPFSLSSSRTPDRKDNNPVTTEKPRTPLENTARFDTASVDLKCPGSQWVPGRSTIQGTQPSLSPVKGSQIPITASKVTESSQPDGRSSSILSTSNHDVKFPSRSGSFSFSSGAASSFPSMSMQTLTSAPVEGGSRTSEKVVKDSSNIVFHVQSGFSFSSSQASAVNSLSSKGPLVVNSVSMQSASKKESLKVGPELLVDKVSTDTDLANTSQPLQEPSSAEDKFKSEGLTPSATTVEAPKFSGSPTSLKPLSDTVTPASDVVSNAPSGKQSNIFSMASVPLLEIGGTDGKKNDTVTPASDVVSNAPSDKQSNAFAIAPVPLSDFGGTTGEKNNSDASVTQEDEMEEEEPETNQAADLSLGSLAGFGLGSAVTATAPKSNAFGFSISSTLQSSGSLTVPTGQLFRPASFSFQSPQASQQSQSSNVGATPGAFGSSTSPQQPPAASGFGQPGQIGFGGQQALGSVLGSFGQSRQIGTGMPGSSFGGISSASGFSNTAIGGGFSGLSSAGGGFASISATSGGFAGAASATGGFAAAAPSGGGFGAVASSGGGFAGGGGFAAAASSAGGFGAFSNQGNSGFSAHGAGAAGGRQPPSPLFTQMRR